MWAKSNYSVSRANQPLGPWLFFSFSLSPSLANTLLVPCRNSSLAVTPPLSPQCTLLIHPFTLLQLKQKQFKSVPFKMDVQDFNLATLSHPAALGGKIAAGVDQFHVGCDRTSLPERAPVTKQVCVYIANKHVLLIVLRPQ